MAKEYENWIRTNSAKGWTRDIILFEDFEDDLRRWKEQTEGAGSTGVDTTRVDRGKNCAKLVTGANLNDTAALFKGIEGIKAEIIKIGVMIMIYPAMMGDVEFQMFLPLAIEDEARKLIPGVRVRFDGTTWDIALDIRNDEGAWEEIAPGFTYAGAGQYMPLSMVIDTKNEKYQKVTLGSQEIDVTAEKIQAAGVSAADLDPGYIYLEGKTRSANAATFEIDSVKVERL